MMPFITRKRHEAEMAAVQETLAVAALALGKACEERDTLQSRLDALTPARGQGGKWVKKATLPRRDDKAGSDAAIAEAFAAPGGRLAVPHG